jgi:hypothetical protein
MATPLWGGFHSAPGKFASRLRAGGEDAARTDDEHLRRKRERAFEEVRHARGMNMMRGKLIVR